VDFIIKIANIQYVDKMSIVKVSSVLFLAAISAQSVFAQGTSVADLQQDMALLKREVGQLRLEVEQVSRQNEELARRLKAVQNSSLGSDTVRAQVSSVRSEVSSQNDALKREIIAQVKKDMENMAAQTNAAIDKLAKAIDSRPQAAMPASPASFGDDYPKVGITYVVKSGDTLGKIARENKSKVKWIQDANKISDPARGLLVGDKIFIPQQN